jgi:hypothetical protein
MTARAAPHFHHTPRLSAPLPFVIVLPADKTTPEFELKLADDPVFVANEVIVGLAVA